MAVIVDGKHNIGPVTIMSIDQSLRRKNTLMRSRNVLTRAERIKVLQNEERWPQGRRRNSHCIKCEPFEIWSVTEPIARPGGEFMSFRRSAK